MNDLSFSIEDQEKILSTENAMFPIHLLVAVDLLDIQGRPLSDHNYAVDHE